MMMMHNVLSIEPLAVDQTPCPVQIHWPIQEIGMRISTSPPKSTSTRTNSLIYVSVRSSRPPTESHPRIFRDILRQYDVMYSGDCHHLSTTRDCWPNDVGFDGRPGPTDAASRRVSIWSRWT